LEAVVSGTPLPDWSARDAIRATRPSAGLFQLSAEDGARFLRIVAECGAIRRHCDMQRWLRGDLQSFLPHDILLSAWGDFDAWELKLDLFSGLPGLRAGRLAHCGVSELVREAYARWCDAGREPAMIELAHAEPAREPCACALHDALRRMRYMLVHGVHDKRSGSDALYVALGAEPFARRRSTTGFLSLVEALVAQVDSAFRRVPALPVAELGCVPRAEGEPLELSPREVEVLEALRRGKTNLDIAAALDISPFTVKNHVQRIFRKIGVSNRTQAAARYAEVLRQPAAS
jgi:transcriptional regulator EpsA